MVYYTLVLQFYFKKSAKKKNMIKKIEWKQSSATTIMPADEKGTVFPVKLKLQRELFE